jgi:hypothetical protein
MSENKEPDWLAELAKGAEKFAAGGLTQPFVRRIVRAVDAGVRELLSAPESPVTNLVVYAPVATATGTAPAPTVPAVATLAGAGTITASGSVALPQARVAGQILALVLVWLLVLVIPAAAWEANLPPEVQALVDVYDGVLANVAVAITFDILGKRKKR